MPGTLYLVATPIGNLEDISLRALRVLKEVALVAAEDTRHSRKLFHHYGIQTPLTSYFAHNESAKGEQLLERLRAGADVALISDAGTPAISDPGELLVRRCRAEEIPVTIIPGPSAVISALAISGLATDRFAFEGFLPSRSKARRELLHRLRQEPRTLIFYEAPHRLAQTLLELEEVLGGARQVAVARELTKLHEELVRGPVTEVRAHFGADRIRGEIVLLIAPAEPAPVEVSCEEALAEALAAGRPLREVSKELSKCYPQSSSEIYTLGLRLKQQP